jgi:hypothetical protein
MAPTTTAERSLSQAKVPIAADSVETAKDRELHNHPKKVHVEFEKFYGIAPTHVDRRFDLRLSNLSYLPKVCSPFPRQCQLYNVSF